MPLCQLPESEAVDEAVLAQLGVLSHVSYRHAQPVWVLCQVDHLIRLLQADLPIARLAGHLADGSAHGIKTGACEVRARVGQPGLVIRACGFDDGQIAIGLQVLHVHGALPRCALLDKEPSQHAGKRHPLSG